MPDDADAWFAQSQSDWDAARHNAAGRFYAVAAFLAQQAAEKALKGLIVRRLQRLRRTHDLVSLAAEAGAPAAVSEKCERLAQHYIASRYPAGLPVEYDEETAMDAIDAAKEVMTWSQSEA